MSEKEFDKFTKCLQKSYFTLNEVRKFVDNDFVVNITREVSDEKHKKYITYNVKLIDGQIYKIYAKP